MTTLAGSYTPQNNVVSQASVSNIVASIKEDIKAQDWAAVKAKYETSVLKVCSSQTTLAAPPWLSSACLLYPLRPP